MPASRRGMTLGSVLMSLMVLTVLAFGLAAAVFSHQHLVQAAVRRGAAQEAARGVVSRGLVELRRQRAWGSDGQAQLEVSYAGEATGTLRFVPGVEPYSTNHLTTPAGPGWGEQPVPGEYAHLVGVGRCRGQQAVVEAWYHLPVYPWAIAAGGPVKLVGASTIASLEALPSPGQAPGALGAADLLCNGDEVFLGAGVHVTGDVITSGRVEVDPDVSLTVGSQAPADPARAVWVEGQVRDGEGEPQILGVEVSSFDPAGLDPGPLGAERYPDQYHLTDTRRREGSVTFEQGLTLEGGMLYVDGDLTVRGGMTGTGLVVCTGKVTVEGATSLTAGSGVALVAGGQVALTGSGSAGSYFQGLVYTDTGFSADRVSLVGPLVSRGEGAVELREAQLLMPKDVPAVWTGGGGAGGGGPDPRETVTTFHQQLGDPGSPSDWHHAIVYQKHEKTPGDPSAGYEYEGTRYDKLPDGTVNPVPAQRVTHDDPARFLLNPDTTEELQGRLVSPDTEDPPPPPADPQAPAGHGVTLDANQFFRLQDRLRQVLWVEH